jgi:hypothetical protein
MYIVQVKFWLPSFLEKKNYETVTFESSHTQHSPGMLQLLYTYDPHLSQGLTVDEKSAHLRGTLTIHFDHAIGIPVEILSSCQCFCPFLVKYRSGRNILYANPDPDSDLAFLLKRSCEFSHGLLLIFQFINKSIAYVVRQNSRKTNVFLQKINEIGDIVKKLTVFSVSLI